MLESSREMDNAIGQQIYIYRGIRIMSDSKIQLGWLIEWTSTKNYF